MSRSLKGRGRQRMRHEDWKTKYFLPLKTRVRREKERERETETESEGFEGRSGGMPGKDARFDDFRQGSRGRDTGHSYSSLGQSRATSR